MQYRNTHFSISIMQYADLHYAQRKSKQEDNSSLIGNSNAGNTQSTMLCLICLRAYCMNHVSDSKGELQFWTNSCGLSSLCEALGEEKV